MLASFGDAEAARRATGPPGAATSGCSPGRRAPTDRAGAVVATNLRPVAARRPARLGWHEIHKATWDGPR